MGELSLDLSGASRSCLPMLRTARLRLRPVTMDDAAVIQRLAGDWEIAATTAVIPHPYPDGAAEEWISTLAPQFAEDQGLALAITLREELAEGERPLVGVVGLTIDRAHLKAELGYWVGRSWWGHGIATEAAGAMIDFGFTNLGLNRIFACHMTRNPASGRVMVKLGMQYEGCQRKSFIRWGETHDLEFYAILREEWEARARP